MRVWSWRTFDQGKVPFEAVFTPSTARRYENSFKECVQISQKSSIISNLLHPSSDLKMSVWNGLVDQAEYGGGDVDGHEDRRFIPHWEDLYGPLVSTLESPTDLITYTPDKGVSQLQFTTVNNRNPQVDKFSLVVSIDGACRNNGKPSARAAYGVYFGLRSPHNKSAVLPADLAQTSSRAELEGLIQAVNTIEAITRTDHILQQVKIVTDSDWLYKTMTQYIWDWVDNGGLRTNGRPAKYFDEFEALHGRLEELTYGDDGGLEFKFWHVRRELNQNADRLANEALDRAGVEESATSSAAVRTVLVPMVTAVCR